MFGDYLKEIVALISVNVPHYQSDDCSDNCNDKNINDFINGHIEVKGKRITKSRLKQCSDELLLNIATCKPELKESFDKYLKEKSNVEGKTSVRKQRMIPQTANIEELVAQLENWVNSASQKEWSITPIAEFRPLLHSIPFGTVSDDRLMQLIEKILEKDLNMSYLLLEYAIAQERALK